MKKLIISILIVILLAVVVSAQQSTSFSYQGKLNSSSNPANGTYDFKFELYSVLNGGTPIGTVNSNGVQVVTGIFSVQLDFGANAFDGTDRFLDISVKLPADSTFTTLTPRQKISSVPYAIKAIAADTATVAQTANNSTSLGGISSSNYLLNTGDGSQLANLSGAVKWNFITGNQQAQSNNGYFVNAVDSANEVQINLPTNPQVGDVVRISGNTYWKLTQNAGQFVTRDRNSSPTTPWKIGLAEVFHSIACSKDGSKLVASLFDGRILTSNDYGFTWTTRVNLGVLIDGLASSADGTKLVGFGNFGKKIFTSADSGVTWTLRESPRSWNAVASSADGTKLVASVTNGQIFTSTDSGVTWIPRETSRNWISVASSSDGTKLVACVGNGQIYTSTDSGVTWIPRETNRAWQEVTSSSDGTRLVARVDGGTGVFVSNDSGITWTLRSFGLTSGGTFEFQFSRLTALSSNGKDLMVASAGSMFIGSNSSFAVFSSDFGQTWTLGPSTSGGNFFGIAASSDFRFIYSFNLSNLLVSPRIETTKVGTLGSITGASGNYIELLYIGNGEFSLINSQGNIQFF